MEYVLTTLQVSDFEKSLEFYRDILGIPVIRIFQNKEGAQIAMLGKESGAHLELICSGKEIHCPVCQEFSIGFQVEDASLLLKKIGRNYTGPISPNPKLKFYFTTDPDGYRIQLLEQNDPA